jgi:hypothetical protein
MKRVKLFFAIAILAILVACTNGQQDPTVVKFKSAASFSVKINGSLDFLVEVTVANSKGNTTITQEGALPAGITFTDNGDKTAKLGGIPTQLGTFALTFKATNNGISTSQAFTLIVNESGSTTGGDGTEANPYSVASARANQGGYKWVTGYIVGYAWSGSSNTEYYFSVDTCNQTTNILIADASSETSGVSCLPVQLPSGSVRTGLNLKDNAANLGKKVVLYGELISYFGQPGLKNTSYYELEDGTTGGTKPVDVGDAVLNETLLTQASFDKFTAVSVIGTEVWTFSTQYGAMMSGFTTASHQNEDWFISPAMDLTGKAGTLQFDHARGPAGSINVGVTQGWYSVWVSNDYTSGSPSTATWTELTGITHGTAAWGFVSSGTVSIPVANRAANCRIAFKYLCSDSESATWEIKNVIVK